MKAIQGTAAALPGAILILVLAASMLAPPGLAADAWSWPEQTRESRPWSYWWWMGSAVDKANLTRELERYRKAGWGGVHIVPIYGARGYERRYIEYLGPQWLEMLRHAASEGRRLDLGVDMTTGTGWCFGGPQVTDQQASATVSWAPGGELILKPGQKVKRAAPGGEGFMLNPFYGAALRDYLLRFDKALAAYDGPKPRAMYHDSFEYRADWSPDLAEEFARRRGYRIEAEYATLFGAGGDDRTARIKGDYRETLSDVLLENFTRPWVAWSHQHGFLTRDQAHGSPGNLLDLYAANDIPETEMFNLDRSTLVSKFASSAAHVMGRRLVASETGTWLKEHFQETLADVKELVDQLFLAGVNHVIYHGTCYSPDDAPWPGWLFYASTQMNPRNPIWRDVGALNSYIARSQSLLQQARADHDLLIYWPVYDIWHDAKGMAQNFTVHRRAWIEEQPFGGLSKRLLDRGYGFDFVSDRQLAMARASAGKVTMPGGDYRALLVPRCDRMPVETLSNLLRLARDGATVVFEDRPPADVPGWGNLESRRRDFQQLLADFRLEQGGDSGLAQAGYGKGRLIAGNAEVGLQAAGVRRESLVDAGGLHSLRLRWNGDAVYLLNNRGAKPLERWIPFTGAARAAVLMDAMSGRTGLAAFRKGAGGGSEVYLQLAPGDTIFVRLLDERLPEGPEWRYLKSGGGSLPLHETWSVSFVEGGPELPRPYQTRSLESWTVAAGDAGRRFAGTARYEMRFDAPAAHAGDWMLDLGRVSESARVSLNGRDLGILIGPAYQVRAGKLLPKGNRLVVEVTNLAANRIRDLDQRKVAWKIFHDINFVGTDYKPFDASGWPLRDSGLLGPVALRPLADWRPVEAAQ